MVAVSLVVGLVSAMTAYSPPLALPDDRLAGLTLNAPAGVRPAEGGARAPIARPGERLTPALLAELRASGESRVRVKEFAAERWTGLPWFALACVGLAAGAWLARRGPKPTAAAAAAAAAPEGALDAISAAVERLRAELPALAAPAERQRRIMDALSVVQETHVPAFVAARPVLVARLGLGGFARLMDRFAAGERQVNRAWSAACDGYLDEAAGCLDLASALFVEAKAAVKG